MTVRSESQITSAKSETEHRQSQNGSTYVNGSNWVPDSMIRDVPPPDDRADLPTFPLESGWRQIYDEETGLTYRSPLTLLDFLYPTEDDIGVVFMAQSLFHDFWLGFLRSLFVGYLDAKDWLVTSDVFIYWHRGAAGPKAPDLAVMRGGSLPDQTEKSYHVGRDGPIPEFVLEITSQDTRHEDLHNKLNHYAAVGVREYLIIDIETPPDEDWRLLGYRLEDSNPFYQPLTPDAEGGLTFDTIGFRLTSTGRSDIAVYDAATGERLLRLDEQRERAENSERENEALRAEIERLKSQQGQS